MENLQKQREKMEAHREALIKKVLTVLTGETSDDSQEILSMAQCRAREQGGKSIIK